MIDGILNNGLKEPTVAQLEQQAAADSLFPSWIWLPPPIGRIGIKRSPLWSS